MGNDIIEYINHYENFNNLDSLELFSGVHENENNYESDSYEPEQTLHDFEKHSIEIFECVSKIEDLNCNFGYESVEYSHLIFTFFTFMWINWEYMYLQKFKYLKTFCMNYILYSYQYKQNMNLTDPTYLHNVSMIENMIKKIMDSVGVSIEYIHGEYCFIDVMEFEEYSRIVIINF
jgi:hypothetical protein